MLGSKPNDLSQPLLPLSLDSAVGSHQTRPPQLSGSEVSSSVPRVPQVTMVATSDRCERCDGLMGPSLHVTCTCELVSERSLATRETQRRGSEWRGGTEGEKKRGEQREVMWEWLPV